jgi:cytochrome P450
MTASPDLPYLAYDHLTDPAEAHRVIAKARAVAPVAMGLYGPEVLTYELVRSVLRDDRFTIPKGFSLPSHGVTSGPLWDKVAKSIISLDGAEHHRLRRLVSKAFAPRSAARLSTTCVEVMSELVRKCLTVGHCDVVTEIARPYPIPIICELLGAPARDWQRFSAWADDILKMLGTTVADDQDDIMRAFDELDAYVDVMVSQRRTTLTDDLISELIRAEEEGDRLTHDELLTMAGGLLIAGTDTTRNQLAAAIDVLCDHPDQWELLAQHPELAPGAVEELVRYNPIGFGTVRVAEQDADIAGYPISAGTTVMVNTASANRDPAVFDEPERLDITRTGAPSTLTFGGGVHYCLGTNLARVELVEALTLITSRISNPRRAGDAPWKPLNGGITGPATLPIEFDRAAA